MTTGGPGGAGGEPGETAEPRENTPPGGARGARAAAADRRAAWAGGRWWAPGALVAAGTATAGWLATAGWRAFEAAGCGSPGAKFECLGETLVAAALAVALGPVLLWLAYRAAGVRCPLLSVPVAVMVAFLLLAAPEVLSQVRRLSGVGAPLDPMLGPGVAVVLGLAALGGGLALQGPRRAVRALVAGAALGALVVAVLALDGPADRARLRGELERAQVPLFLPDGWQPYGPYVGDGGEVSYVVVPLGWPGYGFEGVDVDVSRAPTGPGASHDRSESCSYRPCATTGDITYELPEEGSGTSAWRVVDGHLVTATYGNPSHLPRLHPVGVLRDLSVVGVDAWLARTFDDR